MFVIRDYRPAATPPRVLTDEDCVWDTVDYIPDEDGFNMADYVPCGSYPLSPWEEMILALAR